MRRRWIAGSGLALALALSPPAFAQAADREAASIAGDYVDSQMEMVAGIRLNPDGTFRYGLTVGSLDEQGQGRWVRRGDVIELTSDPRPVAPTITAGPVTETKGAPFAIRVVAPGGNDVPGVGFTIAFDSGEPLESYSRGEPWTLPAEERRVPRFITFAMRQYGLQSARLPLDARAGRTATFVLTPNDFGVADLTGMRLVIDGDTLTLERGDGTLRFKRVVR